MSTPKSRIDSTFRVCIMTGVLAVSLALSAFSTVAWSAAIQAPLPSSRLSFRGPEGVAFDATSHVLYVADDRSGRVLKLSPGGKLLATWKNIGAGPDIGPTEMGIDGAGNVYVEETYPGRIQKFSSTGRLLATWSGVIRKGAPYLTMAVDAAGDVYLGGGGAGDTHVEKLSRSGKVAWRVSLGVPVDSVAVDKNGTVYAAFVRDSSSFARIAKFSPAGTRLSTLHPKNVSPVHMTVDAKGTIYGSDAITDSVDKISRNGTTLAAWRLSSAFALGGIAVDPQGNIYVATIGGLSSGKSSVDKLSPGGKIVARWG